MIEHLAYNPGYKPGTIIKASKPVADAGLSGWVDASGHLLHICKCSESGKVITDFNRGGNASYANCTIQDPKDLIPLFKNQTIKGSWSGFTPNNGYKLSDGVSYKAPKVHLGGDYQFGNGEVLIAFTKDIKVNDCRESGDFGYAIAFEILADSSQDAPESTPPQNSGTNSGKTFKAVREGKTKDNGTFYFPDKYYNDLKDGYQSYDAEDTNGNTWAATTTWTKVYAPEGSSTSEPVTKTVKGYSFKKCSADNGVSFFPIEEYGSTQDDLCFNLSNLKKLSSGAYDLIKEQHEYQEHTQLKEIKYTYYTDGSKK